MHEPHNKEELAARIQKNSRIEGYGLETASHMACPFCGEAEFMRIRVIAAADDMEKGGHCEQCDRGARCIVDRTDPNSIQSILVQTDGPMAPLWLDGDDRPPHIHDLPERWLKLL